MRGKGLAAALALAATQSAALSCLPPDPIRAFEHARDAAETYAILYGSFDFDVSKLPDSVQMSDPQPDPAPIPATFTGTSLGLEGFVNDATSQMTIQPVCFGPWCGGMAADTPVLAFARLTPDGPVVSVDPCGGSVFFTPDQTTLDQMTACLRGEPCKAQDPFPRQ
jgi:hypothetical protein